MEGAQVIVLVEWFPLAVKYPDMWYVHVMRSTIRPFHAAAQKPDLFLDGCVSGNRQQIPQRVRSGDGIVIHHPDPVGLLPVRLFDSFCETM